MEKENNIVVLLVDDDDELRGVLKEVLEGEYKTLDARNGKEAKEILEKSEVDLVFSDVKMPEVDGLELVKWIVEEREGLPVVIMSGYADIQKTEEAYKLGVSGFLPKPFKGKDVLDEIKTVLNLATRLENQDEQFSKVSIDTFVNGYVIPFSVYIRISKGVFVKIAHSGEDLSGEQIERYRKKGDYLYLRKEDFKKYISYALPLAKCFQKSSRVSSDQKIKFVGEFLRPIAQNIVFDGVDRELVDCSRDYVVTLLEVMIDDHNTFLIFENLVTNSKDLTSHLLAVSILSVLAARKVKGVTEETISNIATGALLHDLGKKELSSDLFEVPRESVSPSVRKLLDSHVRRGNEILEAVPDLPEEVRGVVAQHHERWDGTGFPLGLRKDEIYLESRVVQVANDFCSFSLDKGGKFNNTEEILEKLKSQSHCYDPIVLSAFLELFKK